MVMSNAGWGMRNSHALLVWLLIAVIYTKVSGIFIKVENAGGRGLNGHGKTTIKIKLKKEKKKLHVSLKQQCTPLKIYSTEKIANECILNVYIWI